MTYRAPTSLEGGAERALLAELRKIQAELDSIAANRQEILDRRRDTTIRSQPNELVRAVAGSTVVLPHPRPARGQAVGVLVESQPVTVQAPSGTVNDSAELVVTTLGLMVFRSTGDEWWGTAAGGSTGGGMPDIPDQHVLGNDTGATAAASATTVHQVLDWLLVPAVQWVFDGVDDRVDFGNNFSKAVGDSYSLSVWFRAAASATGTLIGKNSQITGTRGYTLGLNNGRLLWVISDLATNIQLQSNAVVADGAWHHVVATYNGSGLSSGLLLYLDGALLASTASNVGTPATTVGGAIYTIGSRDGTGLGAVAAAIRHGALWSTALTSADALDIYELGIEGAMSSAAAAASLQHWAALDEADTAAAGGVTDRTSGGVNGTAEAGLAPTQSTGIVPVRGPVVWQALVPTTDEYPLCSTGPNSVPVYQPLANAGMATMAANTVKGNPTASTATPSDISVGTNTVLGRGAGNIVAAQLVTAQCANDAITNAKLANMAAGTVKGRQIDAGTGDPVDLTGLEQGENIRFDGTQEILSIAPGDYTSASFGTTLAAIAATTSTLHLTASGAGDVNIHGLPENTGKRLVLKKRGTVGRIVFIHESATEATAGARIQLPTGSNFALVELNDSMMLEDQFGRWRPPVYHVPASDSIINVEGKLQRAAGTGDVTNAQNSNTNTIANDAVSNTKLANMAQSTIKLRAAGAGTGDPTDGTIGQALLMLGTPRPGGKLVYTSAGWMYVDELLDEEFYTHDGAAGGTVFGNWNWFQPDGVSMTPNINTARVAGHPGVVQQAAGATATNRALARSQNDSAGDIGDILGEDIAFFRVIVRVVNPDAVASAFNNARFGIGLALHDSSAGSAEFAGTTPNMGGEGIALFKRETSTVWRALCENGGTGADSSTGVTGVEDEWVEAEFIQTSAGTWDIYINGALTNTGITGGPTGTGLVPFIWCDNDSATETRYWQIDKFQIGLRFTNPRYD